MASNNGYVAPKVAEGNSESRKLIGGSGSLLDGYVVQALEVVGDMGLQLVTAARQPHSPGGLGLFPKQVMTAQEVWYTQKPDGTAGRLALAGMPTIISPEQAPVTAQVAREIHYGFIPDIDL